MMASDQILIWQWNCRGFRAKRRDLEYRIHHSTLKPDVIALQETGVNAKLVGYTTFNTTVAEGTNPSTALMIHRNLTANTIDLAIEDIAYNFVEILPKKKTYPTLYILNAYHPPKNRGIVASKLIVKAQKHARSSPLIIVGDFNAHHPAWGYKSCDKKGTSLWTTSLELGLTLLTDPERPTRVGNSICRNTSPDLTFIKNIEFAKWENTETNAGSDHYIIATTFPLSKMKKGKFRVKHTNWDTFRDIRNEREPTELTNLEEWTSNLIEDANKATTEAEIEEDHPAPDSRLIHLWEARESIQKRWMTQKYNKTLRKKIARIDKEVEDYTQALSREHWHQMCDRLNGQLANKNSWFLLRHLIDPEQTKSNTSKNLQKLIHSHPGEENELIQ